MRYLLPRPLLLVGCGVLGVPQPVIKIFLGKRAVADDYRILRVPLIRRLSEVELLVITTSRPITITLLWAMAWAASTITEMPARERKLKSPSFF